MAEVGPGCTETVNFHLFKCITSAAAGSISASGNGDIIHDCITGKIRLIVLTLWFILLSGAFEDIFKFFAVTITSSL